MPIFSIIFGNLMNSFGQNLGDPDYLKEQVRRGEEGAGAAGQGRLRVGGGWIGED